jgi:hypothetical protein
MSDAEDAMSDERWAMRGERGWLVVGRCPLPVARFPLTLV